MDEEYTEADPEMFQFILGGLQLANEELTDIGFFMPFVIAQRDGESHTVNCVSGSRHRRMNMGQKLLEEGRSTADRIILVYLGHVEHEGEMLEAIVCEGYDGPADRGHRYVVPFVQKNDEIEYWDKVHPIGHLRDG